MRIAIVRLSCIVEHSPYASKNDFSSNAIVPGQVLPLAEELLARGRTRQTQRTIHEG